MPSIVVETPARVTVGPIFDMGAVVSMATVELAQGTQVPPFSAMVDEKGELSEQNGVVPDAIRSILNRVGAGRLHVASENASFLWEDVVDEVEHLEAGVELVSFFTHPTHGAFR
jgi:hypothetical protein